MNQLSVNNHRVVLLDGATLIAFRDRVTSFTKKNRRGNIILIKRAEIFCCKCVTCMSTPVIGEYKLLLFLVKKKL